MLGAVKPDSEWHWAAYGKHPMAKDFFSLGQEGALFKALSELIEKGCQILSSEGKPPSGSCSWRFWAKGLKRHLLVCGIVRDSCDHFGRPYPLLVMGTGSLEDWVDHWDLLPLACEKTWRQMEYLATKHHKDLGQFKGDLRLFRPPNAQWSELVVLRNAAGDPGSIARRQSSDGGIRGIESEVAKLTKDKEIFVPIRTDSSMDQHALINHWHFHLRSRLGAIPNFVFMGGNPDNSYMAFFGRALRPSDFARLWSLCASP